MPGSGSNSVGDFLVEEKGFIWLSYSDILREELQKEGKEITRKAMQDLGNEIRERYGAGELSKRLINKMEGGKNYVVGTIRNPAEIEELRKKNVPVGIATGSRPNYVGYILDGLHLRQRVQSVVTAEDIQKSKPDPEIYLKTAKENC